MWSEAASLAIDWLRSALRLSKVSGHQLGPPDARFYHRFGVYIRSLLTDSPLLCRDLDDIGASEIAVQPLNKLPYGKIDSCKPKFSDGVIFLTYSSLISSSDKVRGSH